MQQENKQFKKGTANMEGIKTTNQESEQKASKNRSHKMKAAQLKTDVRKVFVEFRYVWFS